MGSECGGSDFSRGSVLSGSLGKTDLAPAIGTAKGGIKVGEVEGGDRGIKYLPFGLGGASVFLGGRGG